MNRVLVDFNDIHGDRVVALAEHAPDVGTWVIAHDGGEECVGRIESRERGLATVALEWATFFPRIRTDAANGTWWTDPVVRDCWRD